MFYHKTDYFTQTDRQRTGSICKNLLRVLRAASSAHRSIAFVGVCDVTVIDRDIGVCGVCGVVGATIPISDYWYLIVWCTGTKKHMFHNEKVTHNTKQTIAYTHNYT